MLNTIVPKLRRIPVENTPDKYYEAQLDHGIVFRAYWDHSSQPAWSVYLNDARTGETVGYIGLRRSSLEGVRSALRLGIQNESFTPDEIKLAAERRLHDAKANLAAAHAFINAGGTYPYWDGIRNREYWVSQTERTLASALTL